MQRRFQGDKLREALVRLADDKKTQAHLREFSAEKSNGGVCSPIDYRIG